MSRVARPAAERRPAADAAAAAAAEQKINQPGQADEPYAFTHKLTSVAAAGVHKPAGAARSVFDMARPDALASGAARGAQRGYTKRLPPLDVAALVIESGVPVPQNPTRVPDRGPDLLVERLLEGQSTVLATGYVRRLMEAAARKKVGLVSRQVGDGMSRVWRVPYKPRQRKGSAAGRGAGA